MDSVLRDLGLFLFPVGMGSLVWWLLPRAGHQGQLPEPLPDRIDALLGESAGLAAMLRPGYAFLEPLAARLTPAKYLERLTRHLTTAGIDRILAPQAFVSFQAAMLGIFCLLGLALKANASTVMLFGVLGLLYPYWWLYDKKTTRQKTITRSMPDVVDMLALSTAAGLDFQAGIKRIRDLASGRDPFVAELALVHHNVTLGMSMEDALTLMAARVDTPEMYSFSSILVQAQKMGSTIADILKDQAARMRQDRFLAAERAGAVAAQKLLLPMVLFLFPIIFGVVFGPFVMKFLYNR
ncbi:Type II/IV secretion system protein TadC, associated with Flp pilus assembly [Desulfovibrio sp. DV]|uniref:type II secretion system F family protein n=1 Tax=Desulfovibrio sp. DV TaxID=1844708 RepID=UPI00094B9CA6|nr:type II secretion system F family protein [Desulfovibrio sp. DV]OLN30390.1 Type II/IV secretion system protein TadC, associated with Flp pilus assembly [Desulfovibrio sp. DV]